MTYGYENNTNKRKITLGGVTNFITLSALTIFVLFAVAYLLFFIPKAMDYGDIEGGIRYEITDGVITFHANAPIKHTAYRGGLIHDAEHDYIDLQHKIEYRSWYIEGETTTWGRLFGMTENAQFSQFSLSADGDNLCFGDVQLYKTPEGVESYLDLRINRVYYKNSDGSLVLLWSLDGDVAA